MAPGKIAAFLPTVRGKLRAALGEEPEVVLRTVREVEHLVDASPFTQRAVKPGIKLYVVFLSGRAHTRPAFPLVCLKEALEVVAMTDREVFVISYPKKNGFFGFPNNFIEKALGVPATSRNWSTVTKLVEFARREEDG
jgi:uncharacterized protein (DUF1697 family)